MTDQFKSNGRGGGAERNENMTANENLEAKSTLELGSKVNFPYLGGNGMVKCQLFESNIVSYVY